MSAKLDDISNWTLFWQSDYEAARPMWAGLFWYAAAAKHHWPSVEVWHWLQLTNGSAPRRVSPARWAGSKK